jgi:hypothetical protein
MFRPLIALLALALLAPIASAAPIVYTFESPQFTAGQTTPLAGVAPNSGPASFLATFTSAPNAGAFSIINFQPTPQFSGLSLFEPLGSAGNTLTVSFNAPITDVSLNFATNGAGSITLTTPVGSATQASANIGGTFPGGLLSFSSATPFTTLALTAATPGNAPVEFAIDNLTVNAAPTAVPEPATFAVFGVLAVSALGLRRRPKGAPAA